MGAEPGVVWQTSRPTGHAPAHAASSTQMGVGGAQVSQSIGPPVELLDEDEEELLLDEDEEELLLLLLDEDEEELLLDEDEEELLLLDEDEEELLLLDEDEDEALDEEELLDEDDAPPEDALLLPLDDALEALEFELGAPPAPPVPCSPMMTVGPHPSTGTRRISADHRFMISPLGRGEGSQLGAD